MLNSSFRREDYIRKKRERLFIKIGVFFLVLIMLIGIVSYVSHRKEIRISKVELYGGVLVRQSDIEAEILQFLYGSYFWLFPKGNVFLYPKNSLENYLKEKFKRIDTIDIQRKKFDSLSVKITERKPEALWCDLPVPEMGTPEHCYFMDSNSTIFVEAPYFSGDAYFKYYGLMSTSTTVIGREYMASSTQFSDISKFISDIRKLSVSPVYLLAKDNGEFTLVLSTGAEIYFDTKESLSKTSSNLNALLSSDVFPTSSDPTINVDYIDLRFGNKLFYRLKTAN